MRQRVFGLEDWDLIVSSPLQRCAAFAIELGKQREIPLLVDDGFQEMDFGVWEGRTAAQIEAMQAGSLMRFYQDPNAHPPPESEPVEVFRQRVLQSWRKMSRQNRGKRILLISHAGVIRALFSLLLNIPVKDSFAIQINHASLSQFQCFDGETEFVQLNGLYND